MDQIQLPEKITKKEEKKEKQMTKTQENLLFFFSLVFRREILEE